MAIKIVSGEGPISDETLSDTEQRLGISLPPAYCEFQRQYGGGRPNSVQIYRNTAGDLVLTPVLAQSGSRGQALMQALQGFDDEFIRAVSEQQMDALPMQERGTL